MHEVRKEDLLVYLQQKRREGYTLVGLEQASNSVMLERFEFPKKVILLLGEEKGGIPALLLRLLDVCVGTSVHLCAIKLVPARVGACMYWIVRSRANGRVIPCVLTIYDLAQRSRSLD